MIFTSQIFLFWFLPLVLALYYLAPMRWRSALLTLASYVFYGWWRLDFVLLMLLSTVLDFVVGMRIGRLGEELAASQDAGRSATLARMRKRWLLISVVANLGLLGYFKYFNFGVDSLNVLLAQFGAAPIEWAKIVLPVGISFYTFQTMSYSIDVYRGHAKPLDRLVDFACYVALFPQLVAGPIVRYQTLADQLVQRDHTFEKVARGAFLFQIGFMKKLLVADSVAGIADQVYALSDPTRPEAWLGAVAYTFQIYFDFSGYSDMAIGLGLLFGFEFPINFDSPYKSTSITEFWRRWHISLSTWLRDYLYIPLGGNKRGPVRTYENLATTMLLGGLWHGAAWTFLAWGAYQGAWLAFERWMGKRSLYGFLPRFGQVLVTMVIVVVGWVFFRATSFDQAFGMLSAMFGVGADAAGPMRVQIDALPRLALVFAPLISFFAPNSQEFVAPRYALVRAGAALAFPLAVCHLFFVSYSPFLYFQF